MWRGKGTIGITMANKRRTTIVSLARFPLPLSPLLSQSTELQRPDPPSRFLNPAMDGSGAKGKWEASIVTNDEIEDLKRAGYLLAHVAYWALEKG